MQSNRKVYPRKKTYVSRKKYSKNTLAKRYASGAGALGAARTIHQRWLDTRPAVGMLVTKGPSPFPPKLWTTLTYTDHATITAIAGVIGTYTFAANGLYDPNITGTGHQPRYFDTFCGANNTSAPYGSYVVRAARAKVEAMSAGPDSVGIVQDCFITTLTPSSSGPTTPNEVRERQVDTAYHSIGHYYGGRPMATVYKNADICAILGAKDIFDLEGALAAYNANPSSLVRFQVGVSPWNASTEVLMSFIITIEYDVCFFNINDPSDS